MTLQFLPSSILELFTAVPEDIPQKRPARTERQSLAQKESKEMFTTIQTGPHSLAQGNPVRAHADGRVTISTGVAELTGWPVRRFVRDAVSALILGLSILTVAPKAHAESLLNVSYDPTRELYRDINAAFETWWEGQGNAPATIEASHGGSGSQARAVLEGLDAQVVTLALAADIDKIAKEGKLPTDWQSKLPHNASPYTSTIVFLVREGNPKGIKDWGDLTAEGVEVITPNPKTSGGARWNHLAAYGWALRQPGGTEKTAEDYLKKLYANVPVLDTGARGSTTTFVQRGIGDVFISWENEAHLAVEELGAGKFDIVIPSLSILAEPPVAVVDRVTLRKKTTDLARAYLEYLYSPEAQEIIAKHYYRPRNEAVLKKYAANFPDVKMLTINDFGGWAAAQKKHFDDGGLFDQIYLKK